MRFRVFISIGEKIVQLKKIIEFAVNIIGPDSTPNMLFLV